MNIDIKKNEFLEDLAALIEKYDVEITYTTDDDGLHIYMNNNEIFAGWIFGKNDAKKIRDAKDK